MNISVLEKLEKGWVKLNWLDHIHKVHIDDLETIVDLIDNFKTNKGAKELVLFKFKGLPIYVTIVRYDYVQLLDLIYDKFIEKEMYESCKRIINIKNKL